MTWVAPPAIECWWVRRHGGRRNCAWRVLAFVTEHQARYRFGVLAAALRQGAVELYRPNERPGTHAPVERVAAGLNRTRW